VITGQIQRQNGGEQLVRLKSEPIADVAIADAHGKRLGVEPASVACRTDLHTLADDASALARWARSQRIVRIEQLCSGAGKAR